MVERCGARDRDARKGAVLTWARHRDGDPLAISWVELRPPVL